MPGNPTSNPGKGWECRKVLAIEIVLGTTVVSLIVKGVCYGFRKRNRECHRIR